MDPVVRNGTGHADERLVVFTRFPVPGKTKTRLIPALGEQGAAELQRDMTEHVLAEAARLAASRRAAVEVRFEGADARRMADWLGPGVECRPQGCGDLGERMGWAFERAFRGGAKRVLLVGADCPEMDAGRMREAFDALARADLVLGPAADGGYYLVGLRRSALSRAVPALFRDVAWGTDGVLAETRLRAGKIGLDPVLLEELSDVDRPEDLAVWERARAKADAEGGITVVIPALNEEENVASAVSSAASEGSEVIVADGGSTDATREVARSSGARVVRSSRGRARQMNAGVAAASGDILVFLHADTTLPEGYALHVRRALRRPGVAGGAFRFGVDLEGRRYRILERLVNWRSRALSLPYGDQALYMRRVEFNRLGGFRNLPVMEDVDLVRRLRHAGRIAICPASIMTSGRRWREAGGLSTTLSDLLAICSYFGGIPPAQIAARKDSPIHDPTSSPM
jgi:rSAM/selenodomain-associated transferase 2/rSAM/selenodomain-associated transferase 1